MQLRDKCSKFSLIILIIFLISVNIIGMIFTLIDSSLWEFIHGYEKEVLTTLFISILVAVISGYIGIWCGKRKNS